MSAAAIDTPVMGSVKSLLAIEFLNSWAAIIKSVYYGLSVPQGDSIL